MSGKMRFVGILALLALLCGLAFAQTETGAIVGTVTDPQGAVVAGAKVTVKNTQTSAERTTVTNSNGLYTVPNLQPGEYEVKIEAANFAPTAKRLNVTVGSRNTVDFPLSVSAQATTVEVVGEGGVQVDTQTQTISSVVSGQQITELPTITRNPYSLVATAGNVSTNTPGRGAGVSINGQRDASTDILLDGGENQNLFDTTVGTATPLDSVGEFRVITSNFSAEYGRASGGIVNVATKGGTNNFHGTVYEFWRGAGLSSNTYDNNALMSNDIVNGFCTGVDDPACAGRKPNFVRNQFGYSIGGPVLKDKLFFFSSTEWIRVRSTGQVTAWIVDPTFVTTSTAAATQSFFSTYGALKPDLTFLDTTTQNGVLLDRVQYAAGTDSGGGGPRNEYQNVERVDFNWTDKTQMYGRYALQSQDFFSGTVANSPYVGFDTGETVFNNNFLYNITHIWGPNVVTQTKFAFNRLNLVQPLNGTPSPTLYSRSSGNQQFFGTPVMMPGYLPTTPGSGIPFGGPQNLYQIYQDLSWTLGKHQFRFGGSYIHTRDNRLFGAYETSGEALSGSGPWSTSANNLINGTLLSFNGAVDPQGKFPCPTGPTGAAIVTPACQISLPASQPRFDRANRYHDFAFYGQDSWKIHPRFTLNLGVRWEYYGVQHNNDPSFDSNFYTGAGTNYAQQIRNGQVFTVTDPNNPIGGLWTPDYNNWAPRIGFAWDIFGDGKTSLRGGYGIGYERNFGNVTFNVIQNPPNYAVVSIINGDPGCAPCAITTDNLGPLAGGVGTKNLPKTSLRAPIQNMSTAYAHFWSLAIEREIAKNTVLAVEYSGSKGTKEYTIANVNRQQSGVLFLGDNPGVFLNRRTNDQYTGINQRGQGGFSFYSGMNVRFQTTNFHNTGLSLVSNYTWSHAIDNTSSTFSEFGNDFNLGLLNSYIPQEDKGDAYFDIRNRWVMSGTWDTPWFKNDQNWFKKNLLGGWTFAPIVTIQSGGPYTLWDCTEIVFGNVCPRWFYGQALNTGAHDVAAPEGNSCVNGNNDCGGFNSWDYLTFDPVAGYFDSPFGYFNAVTGSSEWGVCGVGEGAINGCPFPSNMSGRNSFRTPGVWNMDMGIYKTFSITERFKLQFRGEFYNIFNHSNLYVQGGSAEADNTQVPYILGPAVLNLVPTGCTSQADCPAAVTAKRGGFGSTATDERRNIQLGLKLIF